MKTAAIKNAQLSRNYEQFQKRAIHSTSLLSNLDKDLIKIMEATRLKNNLSVRDMAELLDIPYSNYWGCVNRCKHFSNPYTIFRFCYIFGYDLEALMSSPYVTIENDTAAMELGARFGGLSDDSLDKIKENILALDGENSVTKKGLSDAIVAYQKSRKDLLDYAKLQTPISSEN